MSMLIAGACCCGSDEPPPPTCVDCPKPNLRLLVSYRGEFSSADGVHATTVINRTAVFQYNSQFPLTYQLVSYVNTGTFQQVSPCGAINLSLSNLSALDSPAQCFHVISPRQLFIGNGLLTLSAACCAPAIPNTPCSQILVDYVPGSPAQMAGVESRLPVGSVVWDGCDVYADDAAYQEVVRDPITNKVVMTYSESASWGAEKI